MTNFCQARIVAAKAGVLALLLASSWMPSEVQAGQVRRTHQGCEIRTEHFVVFATTSEADARWASRQLESGWQTTARLVDGSGAARRSGVSGLTSVTIYSGGAPRGGRSVRTIKWSTPIYGRELVLDLEQKGRLSQDGKLQKSHLPDLRQTAAGAFFFQTALDRRVAPEISLGIANYLARPESNEGSQAEKLSQVKQRGLGSLTADDQVRFLLTAEDGRHAADFVASLESQFGRDLGRWRDWPRGFRKELPGPLSAGTDGTSRASYLSETEKLQQRVEHWLEEPLSGQPVIEAPAIAGDAISPRQRDMVLLLKMFRRFRTAKLKFEPGEMSLAVLYDQLAGADAKPWSTIDTDGTPLLSSDRERIAEIFAEGEWRYRTLVRDKQRVLQWQARSGEVLEAWLEDDKDRPNRPTAKLVRRSIQSNF